MCYEVVATSNSVTRDTLDKNALTAAIAVEELGYRVSVGTLEFHITSLYDLMTIPVPGSMLFHACCASELPMCM